MPRFHPKSASADFGSYWASEIGNIRSRPWPTSAAVKRAKSETSDFTRSRPWPTSAAIKRAKSETSDFAGHDKTVIHLITGKSLSPAAVAMTFLIINRRSADGEAL